MTSLRALFLAAPLALALPGSAQTLLLRYKPPVGKSVTYTMTVSSSSSSPMMPAPMVFSQTVPMTMRVVSRNGNGTTMETKMGQAKVTLPPNSPMAGMKAQIEKSASGMTSTTVVDEFGNLKSMSAAGGSAAAMGMARGMSAGMMQGAQGLSFPKKALKVGDTWSATMDIGKMMGSALPGMKASGSIPIVYKLTALSGGVATITVAMNGSTTMSMGANAMKMAMTTRGTMLVDAATGLLKSMNTTTENDMNLGQAGKMHQRTVTSMKAK